MRDAKTHARRLPAPKLFWRLVTLWTTLTVGCATTAGVRPAGKGALVVGGSIGGPVVGNVGAPLPQINLGARLGLTDRVDIDASIAPPIARVGGLTGGAGWLAWRQRRARPALMVYGHLHLFAPMRRAAWLTFGLPGRDRWTLRAWPQFDVKASWAYGDALGYVGLAALLDPWRPAVRPAAMLGIIIPRPSRWQFDVQLAWLAFASRSRGLPVGYVGVGPTGALAVSIGVSRQVRSPQATGLPGAVTERLDAW